MSDLVLRRAGPADADAVDALTQAAYARWVAVIGRKPRPMTADYHRAVVEHRIDLLEDGGQLAALVEMAAEPDHLLIVNLAVAPERQGQGLGSRLLRHAETVACERGVAGLRLYTNRLMTINIALYGRHGYAVDRDEDMPGGGGVVYMSKQLPAG